MAIEKKCKKCGIKKSFHKEFELTGEGRKRHDVCKECQKLEKAGLNPVPEVVTKESSFDAEREKRKQQYAMSMKRLAKEQVGET